jgi:hypothetical protein
VLLGEVLPKWQLELDLTRLDADEPSAYRVHCALAREAAADSRLIRLIPRFELFEGHRENRDYRGPVGSYRLGRDRAERRRRRGNRTDHGERGHGFARGRAQVYGVVLHRTGRQPAGPPVGRREEGQYTR